MKKIDLGQTITILANVGVIAGIVFLGYEMRQNTYAIQATTLQGMVDLTTSYLIDTALDDGFIQALDKAQVDPDQLSRIEALELQRVIRAQWFRYQSAFAHWRRGSLGDSDWEQYLNFICSSSVATVSGSFSAVQAMFWDIERPQLTDEFVAYVESCRPDLAEAGKLGSSQ